MFGSFTTFSRLFGAFCLIVFSTTNCALCGPGDPLEGKYPDVSSDVSSEDATVRWDVTPEAVFENGKCALPSCEENADTTVSIDFDKSWDWTRRTQKTSCSDIVQRNDPKVRSDSVFSGQKDFGELSGTCIYNSEDKHVGTAKYNTLALCIQKDRSNGVKSIRREVTRFHRGVGRGTIKFSLKGIPDIAGGDCNVTWSVVYE